MAKRPCLDCPTLVSSGSRCPSCTRKRDRGRGTRQQRGYDAAYDAERRGWQRRLDAGEVVMCWACPVLDRPAHPVDPADWQLGHDNLDPSVILGPQCPASNLDTAAMAARRHV